MLYWTQLFKKECPIPDVRLQFVLQILQDFSYKETAQYNRLGNVKLERKRKKKKSSLTEEKNDWNQTEIQKTLYNKDETFQWQTRKWMKSLPPK